MATHSSILAQRIPWTEKPGRLQSMGCKESDTTEQLTHIHTHTQDGVVTALPRISNINSPQKILSQT